MEKGQILKTQKEKMLSGELYLASDPELVKDREVARKLLSELRFKELIPNAPENLSIQPPFYCDYGYNIHCGENVFFNFNCVVLDVTKVTIGSNVLFGPGVQVYTACHPLDHVNRRTLEFGNEIRIGDDCWIGGNAIILPGVTIGHRCIIGAGAVVTKNIPDDSLAVGNPARVIKSLK